MECPASAFEAEIVAVTSLIRPAGARTVARIVWLMGICRMNGAEPHACVKFVLEAIATGHPPAHIDESFPWVFAEPAAKASA